MREAIMRWTVVENVAVTCSTDGNLSDPVWAAFCDELKKKKVTRTLGLSLGEFSMTSVQRKAGAEIAKRQGIKSAVLTDSRMVRGIVTAFSWLGINMKGFSLDQLDEAIKYLDIDTALQARVVETVDDLRGQVDLELSNRRK